MSYWFQAVSTKAAIGEREGKVDNKTKIEIIKEEKRKIEEERNEIAEEIRLANVSKPWKAIVCDAHPLLMESSYLFAESGGKRRSLI